MKWLLGLFTSSSISLAGQSFYDFKVETIDGDTVDLSSYKNKTVLVVNVASKCGFTPQYAGLEALYQKYKDKGFVILGFPSNDFMRQEPEGNAEIKKFCYLNYQVTFPMMSKIIVKSKDGQSPLYTWLTQTPINGKKHKVSWNFNKYLISPDGQLVEHFPSKVEPNAEEMSRLIEAHLPLH